MILMKMKTKVVIDGVNTLWINEKHIEEQLGHKNIPAITNKYYKISKKHRYELVDEPIKQRNRKFLRFDLALKIIMDCRTDESWSLKRNLGFNLHDVINTKEQTILRSIKNVIEGQDNANSIHCYRLQDWSYFHKYKLAIEVDELGYADRNVNNEIERQKALERELNYVFIRINSDENDFNIFKEINKIHRHIKKWTKKSLIDGLSKRLLELELTQHNAIKSKCLKSIVKSILPNYKNEKHAIKNKTDQSWKTIWNNILFKV